MRKQAVLISDLHLGRKDELDDFWDDNQRALVQFLKEQGKQETVDLVLLGDTFDLWQIAPDEEKHAVRASAISTAYSMDTEKERLRQIIAEHGDVFTALGDFIRANAQHRVLIVPGNHDHALVSPEIQQVVTQAIAGAGSLPDGAVTFPLYYDEPQLRLYAEHGNQIDPNNAFSAVSSQDCLAKGYYFVRIFWNRLETQLPALDVWWNSFAAIVKHRLWKALKPAAILWKQYQADKRYDHISLISAATYGVAEPSQPSYPLMAEFPDVLLGKEVLTDAFFSSDPGTEERMRTLYDADPEFRQIADELLAEKYGTPPTIPVSLPFTATPQFSLLADPYLRAAEGMFTQSINPATQQPLRGSRLDDNTYDYVIFGHTHAEKTVDLPHLKATYYNTGAWATRVSPSEENISKLCFTVISSDDNGTITPDQQYWPLKRSEEISRVEG